MMEMSPEIMERMDKYLEGRMPAEERLSFEEDLKNSSQLSLLFNEHKSMVLAVEASSIQKDLRKVIQQNRQSSLATKQTRSLYSKIVGIAAAVVILLGLFFMIDTGSSPAQKLFAEYYVTDPGLPTFMGNESDVAFQNAMTTFKQGNFDDALSSFNTLLEKADSDTLKFYASMCHLDLSQSQESIALLKTIEPSSSLAEKASWYLALSYLQEENTDEAKKVLEQITNEDGHLFFENAKKLLQEIDQ